MIALYVVLSFVLIFIFVILIRTLRFKPKKLPEIKINAVTVDEEKAAYGLSEMIK